MFLCESRKASPNTVCVLPFASSTVRPYPPPHAHGFSSSRFSFVQVHGVCQEYTENISSFLPFFQVSVKRLQVRSMNATSCDVGSPLHSTACTGAASNPVIRTQMIQRRLTDTPELPWSSRRQCRKWRTPVN